MLSARHPLPSLPNVLATPHIAFVERGNYERYFGDAFDPVNAFAAGKPVRVVERKPRDARGSFAKAARPGRRRRKRLLVVDFIARQ